MISVYLLLDCIQNNNRYKLCILSEKQKCSLCVLSANQISQSSILSRNQILYSLLLLEKAKNNPLLGRRKRSFLGVASTKTPTKDGECRCWA